MESYFVLDMGVQLSAGWKYGAELRVPRHWMPYECLCIDGHGPKSKGHSLLAARYDIICFGFTVKSSHTGVNIPYRWSLLPKDGGMRILVMDIRNDDFRV